MLLTLGLVLVLGLGRGLGGERGGRWGLLRSSVFSHPPNFRLTPETPEPLNKNIFYDADITPEGKHRYLPGFS